MAEGPSAAYKKTKEEWRRDSREKEQRIKKLFSSVHWYYPVHKYIGDIVQNNKFSIDYESRNVWICFQWYCDTVSEFMTYLLDWHIIATAVIRVLPTRRNILKGLPSDMDALISEKDAIYVLATYNLECFEYLLRSFAIGLKESCLGFVELQLRGLIEKETVIDNLSDQIREFASKQSDALVEQQKKTIEGLQRLVTNKRISGIKRTTPLSFIMSEEIDPEKMPPVPRDPKLWEQYFLQVCSARLSLTLAKEEEQWDADSSEPHEQLRPRMIDQFKRLRVILSNPSVPRPYSFTSWTKLFREEISRIISEKLHVD